MVTLHPPPGEYEQYGEGPRPALSWHSSCKVKRQEWIGSCRLRPPPGKSVFGAGTAVGVVPSVQPKAFGFSFALSHLSKPDTKLAARSPMRRALSCGVALDTPGHAHMMSRPGRSRRRATVVAGGQIHHQPREGGQP